MKAHNAAHTGCNDVFATRDIYPERVLQQRKLAREMDNNLNNTLITKVVQEEETALIKSVKRR